MPVFPPRSADTTAEAERVQIELLRRAPVSQRLHLSWSLSARAIRAARRAIARATREAIVTADDPLAAVAPVAACLDRLHVRYFVRRDAMPSNARDGERASLGSSDSEIR